MGGHTSSWVAAGVHTTLFTKLEHDAQQQQQQQQQRKERLTNYASLFEEIPLIHEKGLRIYIFLIYENLEENGSLRSHRCRKWILKVTQM
jgi:hypothetical protein